MDKSYILNAVDILNKNLEELGVLSEYVKIGTYTYTDENGVSQTEPSIDMGESDTSFKLKITNTKILFTDSSNELVKIEREKITVNAIKMGGWVWRPHGSGYSIGLVWEGV